MFQFCIWRQSRQNSFKTIKQTLACLRRCYSSAQSRQLSPLTSCSELHERMQQPKWYETTRILDARWDLDDRDYYTMHIDNRICCSKFFSFEECRDVTSPYPRMLPTSSKFGEYVTKLGISNNHHVVVYDDHENAGLYSSPRVWWMFRVFGHDKVSVLDGGLTKWLSDGYPSVSGPESEEEVLAQPLTSFNATMLPRLVKEFGIMKKNAQSENPIQVADARGRVRFNGIDKEGNVDKGSGHIPQSFSTPFMELFNKNNRTLLDKDELVKYFTANGLDLNEDIITTCGSGITAAIVAHALYYSTGNEAAVYDGSWTEWKVRAPQLVSRRERK